MVILHFHGWDFVINNDKAPFCFWMSDWSCWMDERYAYTPTKGYFTYKPRVVTMELWEPKRKCPKVLPEPCSLIMTPKCSVKSYVYRPWPIAIWMNSINAKSSYMLNFNKSMGLRFRSAMIPGFVLGLLPRGGSWK